MRIDYLGLEAFVAIADFGSFRRAAAHLNLSQTALSHRLQKIEEELGTQLLLRTTREVSLTLSGQELLPRARHHLSELAHLYGALHKRGRQNSQQLNLACLPTIAGHYLPEILHRFAERHPRLMIRVLDHPVDQVIEAVQSGEVEFGISIVRTAHSDIEVRALYTEPYVLMVPRDHPLAGHDGVTREDLVGQPFVRIRTQHTNRKLVDDALGEYSDRMTWRYEVRNAATAVSLVAAGVAVSVLPKLAANMIGDKLVALEFRDVEMSRPLGLLTRRDRPLSPAAEELARMIAERLSTL